MPSGSHSSGGGSHFGGGSHSSGGSHFGGGSSQSNSSKSVNIRIGGRSYIVPGKASSFSVLIIVFVLLAVFSGMMFLGASGAESDIKIIKNDYVYYQDMIAKTKTNPDLIKEAEITGKFYNEDCDKWYIEYEIISDINLPGHTFSVYSYEEISNFDIGQIIQVAVDSETVKITTDSIPMDYENMPIEKDGEYIELTKEKTTLKIIGFVLIGVDVFVLIGAIYSRKKQKSLSNTQDQQSTIQDENVDKKDTPFSCSYCGAIINGDKCSNCGAPKK